MPLPQALRLIRVFHDLSQTELAEDLHVSKSFLSEIEAGKKNPTMELLQKYANIFNMPVSSIMLFSENMNSKKVSEKFRAFATDKIVKLLEWLALTSDKNAA